MEDTMKKLERLLTVAQILEVHTKKKVDLWLTSVSKLKSQISNVIISSINFMTRLVVERSMELGQYRQIMNKAWANLKTLTAQQGFH